MHFKASTIKVTQQDAGIRYQQLVTFHTAPAMAQISYCMAARASQQILALRDVKARVPSALTSRSANICCVATRNHTITNTCGDTSTLNKS